MILSQTFETILEKIRKESKNTVELGTKFEKLTKDFLTTDKHYANRFEKVWLWKEYPKNDGHDTGIDLVAKERGGELCAIQCKCYADDGTLDMKSVSTFLAKANSLKMKNKLLVYTGDNITTHAKKVTEDSKCTVLRKYHLLDSSIEWGNFPKISVKKPKQLRPHQQQAVKDVLKGFSTHDRGKMIMACGTGKTLTSLHIAEKQIGKGGIILYLVPSISLILQSMREWSGNANMQHYYLAVCSDKSTGEDGSITELEAPVSTSVKDLEPYLKSRPRYALTVIFSTYHSIDVVKKALGGRTVDLMLCDEAHRTTGVEDQSFFTIPHKDSNILARKRLYMTATPRVYSDVIQAKMDKTVYSMDNEEKYGPEFHNLNFTNAVKQKILSDFKVKIAIVPADYVDKEFQLAVADKDNSIPLDERTLLAAVWHGLCYPDDNKKPKLLQRVIAFANRIDRSMMFAGKITDQKNMDRSFKNIVRQYEEKKSSGFDVEVDHIDGKTKALERRDRLQWLGESTSDPKTCRILSNARCLAEGVDVPALDGIIFLNPRKSRVDVVQSVGRVMRKSKDKDFGYVILPVAIPAGIAYHKALDDNKTFKVVWQVLNALRSHDENFASEINTLVLDKKTPRDSPTPRISVTVLDSDDAQEEPLTKFFDKIKSKLVEKVGDINYYEKYGMKMGQAARTIQERIQNRIESNSVIKQEIQKFHSSLQIIINDSVTEEATVQVIAQHMVLSRVFDLLFQGEFTSHNPISSAFNEMIKKIRLDEELEELEKFYADVKNETRNIISNSARQNFIKKIYGNFFESMDKKKTEQHGVVYTPIEVVDFIIHSTQYLLKEHFGIEFNDRAVKVLEPFAGTGTFITRLLDSGLITSNMYEKYKNDLYANEIILLAYYIAIVNIETTYSSHRRGNRYLPFDGMAYTDTLSINPKYRQDKRHREESTTLDDTFKVAHERIRNQRGAHIHVIMGNPPYSMGQKNYNDENPNISYPEIDDRIKNTYLKKTNVGAKNSLYDSYVRSLRWASDRIDDSGIIAFITNASFIKSVAAAGIRASLVEEFNEIWCFDLRGNQRTQGEISKREGGKIFGSGSRAPVAITLLVKNSNKKGCTIFYKNIGDYHSRERKLEIINNTKSIHGITSWIKIKPDKHYDWLGQRNNIFSNYVPMGNNKIRSKKSILAIFETYSRGLGTSRDAWAYNSSIKKLSYNMKRHVDHCNDQDLDHLIFDSKKAKWTPRLTNLLKKDPHKQVFDKNKIVIANYRPFFKKYLYFDRVFNNEFSQISKFFPESDFKNLIICVSHKNDGEFSTIITNIIPDLGLVGATQCFPLYVYKNRQNNITDYILKKYQNFYATKEISKEDIFYYVYGLLHHQEYRKKFANNLAKEFPHIPMAPDFKKFSDAGKKLADLHLSFDTCKRYNLGKPKNKFGKVISVRFATKKDGKKRIKDKTTLQINKITVFDNIPDIQYSVNGRTPIEWIIDRYKITTDKDSGIVNDPCSGIDIIAVIERAIYVGVESDKIIKELPKEFEPKNWKPKKIGLDQFNNTDKPAQTRL